MVRSRKTTLGAVDTASLPEKSQQESQLAAWHTQSAADNAIELGRNVREARGARSWTLEETSRRTGVGRSTLSKIENGLMSPTFDILQKLVSGMELDLAALFDTQRSAGPSARRSITRSGGGKPHETATYVYEFLATDLARKKLEPMRTTIKARDLDDFNGWIRHDGEEFAFVLSGRIRLYLEFYSTEELGPGDSVYLDSNMGHALVSISAKDAEVVWISSAVRERP